MKVFFELCFAVKAVKVVLQATKVSRRHPAARSSLPLLSSRIAAGRLVSLLPLSYNPVSDVSCPISAGTLVSLL